MGKLKREGKGRNGKGNREGKKRYGKRRERCKGNRDGKVGRERGKEMKTEEKHIL